jgi:hypothetical protein
MAFLGNQARLDRDTPDEDEDEEHSHAGRYALDHRSTSEMLVATAAVRDRCSREPKSSTQASGPCGSAVSVEPHDGRRAA